LITTLRGKDYIATQDWATEELDTIIDVAHDLKRSFALGRQPGCSPTKHSS
jgi:ornithine carbamoyltransferase